MLDIDLTRIVAPGKNAMARKVVQKSDTAANYSDALKELLATVPCVDMVTRLAIEAVDKQLPAGYITVGNAISMTHEAPTMLGMTVNVKVTLTQIHGSHLYFDFVIWDELGEVGRGKHERSVIKESTLQEKVKERKRFLVERSF